MTTPPSDDARSQLDGLKSLATNDPDRIEALPAREIHVGYGGQSERPVMLTIGIYGRNGRGGAAHGVQLTYDGAFMLMRDLGEALGVSLRPARSKKIWRVLRWPRAQFAVRQVERDLRRVLAAPPSEEELLRAILGDEAADQWIQIPPQRTACVVSGHEEDTR
jgi:hypothetical protein